MYACNVFTLNVDIFYLITSNSYTYAKSIMFISLNHYLSTIYNHHGMFRSKRFSRLIFNNTK